MMALRVASLLLGAMALALIGYGVFLFMVRGSRIQKRRGRR